MRNTSFIIRITTVLLFFFSIHARSQNYQWSAAFGAASYDIGTAVTCDQAGNTYLVGVFRDSIDVDPGPNIHWLHSSGDIDVFLAKYSPSGSLLASFSIGSYGGDYVADVIIVPNGDVLITGTMDDSVDFDPGPGTAVKHLAGTDDLFFARYDSVGNYKWAFNLGGPSGITSGNSIFNDASGNIYITGSYRSTVDFDPGPDSLKIPSNGSYDGFVAKYTSTGQLIWAKNIGGTAIDGCMSVAVDNNQNVFVAGYFSMTADLDPGPNVHSVTSAGGEDIFICKLDSSATFQWAITAGDVSADAPSSIAIDHHGDIVITGFYYGNVDFDGGPGQLLLASNASANETFIVKYRNDGSIAWANGIDGSAENIGASVAIDASDNIHVCGTLTGTADFNAGAGTAPLSSAGGRDIYYALYDSTGNYISAFHIGSTVHDNAYSVAVTSPSRVLLSGYFSNTTDFDFSPATANQTSNGGYDAFVASYEILTSGISKVEKATFNAFPNPVNDFLTIEKTTEAKYELSLHTIQGQELKLNYTEDVHSILLDLRNIPSGIYFVEINCSSIKSEAIKIIRL